MSTPAMVAIIIVLALVVIALVAWLIIQNRQSKLLKTKFGPEYERVFRKQGNRAKAERELKEREERVSHLHIMAITPSDASRFSEEWRAVQARFVDNPQTAVNDADRLVIELMQKRGYPVADFETRVADVSVDHPRVVENYRAAHGIALRNERGSASTEDLRRAFVHYRSLFDELLEVQNQPEPVEVHG